MSNAEDGAGLPSADWLSILDLDPDTAERRYTELHQDLTRFLEWQHDDPEEAAQEALIRGFKRIAADPSTLHVDARAYFFGIARNMVREGWRKRRREAPLDPAVEDRLPSKSRGHEQVDARLMLTQALGHLTKAERQLLVKYCTEDDHDEHCRELRVSPGNLRVMVHRIREDLRRKLQPGLRKRRAGRSRQP